MKKSKTFQRKTLPKSPTSIQGFDEITGGGLPKGRPTPVSYTHLTLPTSDLV